MCGGLVRCEPVILADLHKYIWLSYKGEVMPLSNHNAMKKGSKPKHTYTTIAVAEGCVSFPSGIALYVHWINSWMRNLGVRDEEFRVENKFFPFPSSTLHTSAVVSEWVSESHHCCRGNHCHLILCSVWVCVGWFYIPETQLFPLSKVALKIDSSSAG